MILKKEKKKKTNLDYKELNILNTTIKLFQYKRAYLELYINSKIEMKDIENRILKRFHS